MKHAFQLPAWPLVAIAALAMVAAYANGLRGTFVMDDVPAIVDNESIRTLWPPWVPTFEGGALAHRPLPYFTFALNHAIHRLELPGYHAVNIGLHCLNGVLMGLIVTHVLRLAGWRQPPHIPAEWVGAAAACDWIVLRTKPRDLVTKRLPLYAGLFACWPLVVVIVRLQADRYPESQGIGYGPLAYLANQPAVIVLYLRLAAWPTKLCFDYGWPVYRTWHHMAPWCVLVGSSLAVATSFGNRRHISALPALMFFTLLAPTSSLIPWNELCTEHRMYAPLAPLCAILAFGLVIAALVVPLAAVAKARNACYDSRLALRLDTGLKAPSNPRAHRMLACELADLGRPKDALPFLRNAIELQPRYPLAYVTLGQVFETLGQTDGAIDAYARAAELDPANAAVMSRLQVLKAATAEPPTADQTPP